MSILVLLVSLGCEEKLSDVIADSSSDWGGDVVVIDNTDDISGDLSDGTALESLEWASLSSVACWPGNEDQNFTGSHVFFATDQPAHSLLTATVVPDASDIDVNVYILQQGTADYQKPPDVTSVVTCEAGYPQSTDSNPGEEDSASVTAINNAYSALIGVAGPQSVLTGGFTLSLDLEDY